MSPHSPDDPSADDGPPAIPPGPPAIVGARPSACAVPVRRSARRSATSSTRWPRRPIDPHPGPAHRHRPARPRRWSAMICPVDGTSVLVMTERQGIEIDYCPSVPGRVARSRRARQDHRAGRPGHPAGRRGAAARCRLVPAPTAPARPRPATAPCPLPRSVRTRRRRGARSRRRASTATSSPARRRRAGSSASSSSSDFRTRAPVVEAEAMGAALEATARSPSSRPSAAPSPRTSRRSATSPRRCCPPTCTADGRRSWSAQRRRAGRHAPAPPRRSRQVDAGRRAGLAAARRRRGRRRAGRSPPSPGRWRRSSPPSAPRSTSSATSRASPRSPAGSSTAAAAAGPRPHLGHPQDHARAAHAREGRRAGRRRRQPPGQPVGLDPAQGQPPGPLGIAGAVAAARAAGRPAPCTSSATASTRSSRPSTPGADALLLDNMTPDEVAACVALADEHAAADRSAPPLLEVSGGITLETVGRYAGTRRRLHLGRRASPTRRPCSTSASTSSRR